MGSLMKGVAGLVLGFLLAIGCSKLFVMISPEMAQTARAQLAMWLVMPVWLTVAGISFAFRNAVQAWCALGALNLVIFSLTVL